MNSLDLDSSRKKIEKKVELNSRWYGILGAEPLIAETTGKGFSMANQSTSLDRNNKHAFGIPDKLFVKQEELEQSKEIYEKKLRMITRTMEMNVQKRDHF
jgi:hypothetical protein